MLMNNCNDQRDQGKQSGRDTNNRQDQQAPRRYNPRLVFADPDEFFSDLLMEQEEQG